MKASSALPCALAALLTLTAQTPSGTAVAPPVTINSCAFNPWTLLPIGATGMFLVRFAVQGGAAADDVRFRMLWGDDSFTPVDDAGSFAPGTEIRHQLDFTKYGEVGGEMFKSLNLVVEHVHLTNGTTWDVPSLSAAPSVKCVLYFGLSGR